MDLIENGENSSDGDLSVDLADIDIQPKLLEMNKMSSLNTAHG